MPVLLRQSDYPECSGKVVGRTSGKEEVVGAAIFWLSSTELNAPQLVDNDFLPVRILYRTHKLAGFEIESVNRTGISVVRNQQRIAQLAKILWRNRESPRLVQGCSPG